MATERTFSIIKPDATRRNLTGAVTKMLEDGGLRVVASRRIQMSRKQAEGFYAVHSERPFFNDLVAFMISLFRRIWKASNRFILLEDYDSALLIKSVKVNFLTILFFALQADVLHFPLKGWWLAVGLGVVLDRYSKRMMEAKSAGMKGEEAPLAG